VTVELANKLDGTDHGDGRVESVDERWRTDGGVEWNGGAEDEVGRTDEADGADDVGPAKDRRGQRTVEADGRSNSRRTQSRDAKTLYLQQHTTQINNLTQQQSTKLRKLRKNSVIDCC